MSAAPDYAEVHRLVDRLTTHQARAVRAMLVELVTCPPAVPEPTESMLADEPVRILSFIGLMHAEPDLAERSEEILRAEFGKHADDRRRHRTVGGRAQLQ